MDHFCKKCLEVTEHQVLEGAFSDSEPLYFMCINCGLESEIQKKDVNLDELRDFSEEMRGPRLTT